MRCTIMGVLICLVLAASICRAQSAPQAQPSADGQYGPARVIAWGAPVNGLQLGIEGRRDTIVMVLKNVGDTALVLPSHVNCVSEWHFDWYLLLLIDSLGCRSALLLDDDRDASETVYARLEPRDSIRHLIYLPRWAAARGNLYRVDISNRFQIYARYIAYKSQWGCDHYEYGDCWEGKIQSDTIGVFVNPAEPAWVERRREVESWYNR